MTKPKTNLAFAALLTAFVVQISSPRSVLAVPILADPSLYGIELFAELQPVEPNNAFFKLLIANNASGFAPGLYATGGPFADNDFFRVDATGQVTLFQSNLTGGNESVIFAQGSYGSGMLITEPLQNHILRKLPSGTPSVFSTLGTAPFGPADLTFGPGGVLYATDFTGDRILSVDSGGTPQVFATLSASGGIHQPKSILHDVSGQYGGGFLISTFHFVTSPTGSDGIFSVSADGSTITPLVTGIDGGEFLTFDPSGTFSTDAFVTTMGTNAFADGTVFTVAPDGTTSPFLTNIDAISIAFDTEGVLGGGMFISDITNQAGADLIWRVTIIPEPSTFLIWSLLGALAITVGWWRWRK